MHIAACGTTKLPDQKDITMKMILRSVLILGVITAPACAGPPHETETERTSRINGIALGSTVVIATLMFFFVQLKEGVDKLNSG